MSFRLSEDQRLLQDSIARLTKHAMEEGGRRRAFEEADGFASDFWSDLLELGVAGIAVEERYGGLGLGLTELCLAAEVLGYHGAPGPFLGHVLAVLAIQTCGTEAQKTKWLPRLVNGEALATIALAERGGHWRPSEWRLTNAAGRITGTKQSVLYPEKANLIVVGTAGPGLGLVAPQEGSINIVGQDVADRTRRTATVEFNGAAVEGLEGEGDIEYIYTALLNLLAADAFGGALRCIDMTVEYVKARHQFGTTLASFHGVKHRLANLISEAEPARALYWYSALCSDLRRGDKLRIAALTKAHLADIYNQTARAAVELHGGIGFTWDYDLQIFVKRAAFDFAFGTVPTQLRRLSALLDDENNEDGAS
jgi:alkylation response protein AidB-like acyl-CoA dehydrogenase